MTFGPSGGQHQADVQETAVRMAFALHPAEHRPDDLVEDALLDAGVSSGLGANAPMPPVFGPRSSSKMRL